MTRKLFTRAIEMASDTLSIDKTTTRGSIIRVVCILTLLVSSLHAAEPTIEQGLVVLVDCKDVPENLRTNEALRIHGLTKDAAMVQDLRQTLLAQEAADTVAISSYDGQSLPYIDNLVNLVIAPDTTTVSEEEMLRVLVPLGRAVIGDRVVTKPWLEAMDEWPQFLHGADNNAVADDQIIGAPKHMQWLGGPQWARSHDRLASTSALASTRGRIYYIMDEGPIQDATMDARWHLAAIDAFNGLPLWERPMKSWVNHMRHFRSGPVQIARLLVADGDTVYALDTATGKTRWQYVAGGTVDSPPTVADQRVLFGAADGKVTCLSFEDGEVMWQFNAAPLPLKAMAMGELESLWPVSGSVLVKDDTVYFTAGRSSYLDGGLFLFGLSVETGEVKYRHRYYIDSPGPLEKEGDPEPLKNGPNIADWKTFEGADHSDSFSMVGNVNDVMVADSDSVYLRHMRFNDRLEPQSDFRLHLFSSGTLLDSNEAYRSHWFYGTGDFSLVPVSYGWLAKGTKKAINGFLGNLLVQDGETLWGMERDRDRRALVSLRLEDSTIDSTKNYGARKQRIEMPYKYRIGLPFRVRAMVKAGPRLYLGGAETVEQILGEVPGGVLQTFAAADGRLEGSPIALKASPVFDGMAVGDQALFISLVDGSLVCLK